MKPERTHRLWPPFLVTIASIAILIGCIPIPAFNRHAGPGPRPDHLIGKRPTSDKPLAIGRSTVADVELLFGRHMFDAPDSVYVDQFHVVSWYVILCGFPTEVREDRWLVIRFGPDGAIADYDVYSSYTAVRKALGGHFSRHRPTTQELRDNREYWLRVHAAAATRRATQPVPSR